MSGGDAAHLPALLSQLLKKYTGEGIPLKEPIANLVVDDTPKAGGKTDPNQTLLDRWITGGKTPPAKEVVLDEEELNRVDSVLGKKLESMRGKLEKMGICLEMRGDGGYDARYVFSLLASLGITPIIKIRTNANARSKGVGRARALAALEQFGGVGGCSNEEFNRMTKAERKLNQKRWKKDIRYRLRWII